MKGSEYIMNNDHKKLLLLPQKCKYHSERQLMQFQGCVQKRGLQFNNFISVKIKNLLSLERTLWNWFIDICHLSEFLLDCFTADNCLLFTYSHSTLEFMIGLCSNLVRLLKKL